MMLNLTHLIIDYEHPVDSLHLYELFIYCIVFTNICGRKVNLKLHDKWAAADVNCWKSSKINQYSLSSSTYDASK